MSMGISDLHPVDPVDPVHYAHPVDPTETLVDPVGPAPLSLWILIRQNPADPHVHSSSGSCRVFGTADLKAQQF